MENKDSLVKIRPFSDDDKKSYYDISCCNSVKEYFPYYSENYQEACDIVKIFSKGDFSNSFYFAIEEKEEGNLVGAILAERVSEHDYNIGYFIGQKFHNKGYATYALKLLIEYLKEKGAKSVNFSISSSNIASLSVANKINAMKISENGKYEVWRKMI